MHLVVIGGGAAGFFGAISAATAAKTHSGALAQTKVTLLEAGHQLLSKVRISGGGRCNVTHACFDPAVLSQNYPRGGKALRGPLTRFQPKDTIAWFTQRGVELKTEADGRMFPVTDDSETIVNCLIQAAKAAGVMIRTGVSVKSVVREADQFQIELKSGEVLTCDRILLATGSNPQGYAIARSLGHQIEPPVPSLFTFNLSDSRLQGLAGISVPSAHLRLQVGEKTLLEQIGPVLITHWGLSGPAVLKLSAWGARALHEGHYRGTLRINWLPQFNPETLRQYLLTVKSENLRKLIASNCPVALPRRFWERLVIHAGIDDTVRWTELSNKSLNRLIEELTQGCYTIAGKGAFKEEFVTCGGIRLKEIDFKTMESRCCPGLYCAGEVLDIDGITGGFNFQSAWTTGWIAGQAMAEKILEHSLQ